MLLTVNNSETITATVQPTSASNKSVTWSSSDETVATVDASGKVTGIKGGTATITVTSVADSSKKATVQVIVGDLLVPAGGSIQDVINEATTGQVIAVAQGIYEEQLTISKEITLLGPNADISGHSENRVGEAIITYPETKETNGNNWLPLISITANNVKVSGLTVNDNVKNFDYNTTGIISRGNNATITNNVVDGFNYVQIWLRSTLDEDDNYTGANVEGNYTKNSMDYSSIYLQGTSGNVKNNKVEKAGYRGIQIQPYNNPNTGIVEDNNISGYYTGIYYNYATKKSGMWTIKKNNILLSSNTPATLPSTPVRAGIQIETFSTVGTTGNAAVLFEDNFVDISLEDAYGLDVNNASDDGVATFTNNTFENVGIGAQKRSGSLDLGTVLSNNTFPAGYKVVGNEIRKVTADEIAEALTSLNDELTAETLNSTAAMDALENEVLGLDLTRYEELFIEEEDPAYTSGGTQKDRQKAVPGDLKGMMPDGGFETVESLQEALNASVEMRIAKRDAVIMVNSAETIQELDFATFYTRVINAYVNNPLLKDTKEYRTKGVETIAKYNNLSDASKEAVLTAVLEGGTGPNGNYLGHSQIYSLTNTQVDLAAAE